MLMGVSAKKRISPASSRAQYSRRRAGCWTSRARSVRLIVTSCIQLPLSPSAAIACLILLIRIIRRSSFRRAAISTFSAVVTRAAFVRRRLSGSRQPSPIRASAWCAERSFGDVRRLVLLKARLHLASIAVSHGLGNLFRSDFPKLKFYLAVRLDGSEQIPVDIGSRLLGVKKIRRQAVTNSPGGADDPAG